MREPAPCPAEHEGMIVCPHCRHEEAGTQVFTELAASDELECMSCGGRFLCEKRVQFIYTTRPIGEHAT